ncbi:hypothetical protein L1887_54143 [Cichorium endivia]|nr:hypothetical protein L1887_54143 [Cichorium endivia]
MRRREAWEEKQAQAVSEYRRRGTMVYGSGRGTLGTGLKGPELADNKGCVTPGWALRWGQRGLRDRRGVRRLAAAAGPSDLDTKLDRGTRRVRAYAGEEALSDGGSTLQPRQLSGTADPPQWKCTLQPMKRVAFQKRAPGVGVLGGCQRGRVEGVANAPPLWCGGKAASEAQERSRHAWRASKRRGKEIPQLASAPNSSPLQFAHPPLHGPVRCHCSRLTMALVSEPLGGPRSSRSKADPQPHTRFHSTARLRLNINDNVN